MIGTARRFFALRSGFLLTAVFATLSAAAFCQTAPPAPAQEAAPVSQNAAAKTVAYEAVTIKPDDNGNGFFKLTPDS
ncbi:MAG: hypothetical protein WBA18_09860, partial [Terracidiphilus sp.]